MGSSEIGYVLGGVRSISCRSLLEYFSSFLTAVHAPTVCSDLVSLIRLRCIFKRERSMAAAKVRSVFTISFKVASVFSPLRTISLLPIRHQSARETPAFMPGRDSAAREACPSSRILRLACYLYTGRV